MKLTRILSVMLAATATLSACDGFESPTEPEPVSIATGSGSGTVPGVSTTGLAAVSELLVGAEDLETFTIGTVPVGDLVTTADSLSVVTIDLLGTLSTSTTKLSLSTTTTTDNSNVQDGEKITTKGTFQSRSKKTTYSDGTEAWGTDISSDNLVMTGQSSGAQCKPKERFMVHTDRPGGASTWHQQAVIAMNCPGGRVVFFRVIFHLTVTPSGNINTFIKDPPEFSNHQHA